MNDVNPYESPKEASFSAPGVPSQLRLPGWGIVISSAITSIVVPIMYVVDNLPNWNPSPPTYADILIVGWMLLTPAFGVLGGVAMIRMRYRRLVLATAILACIPIFGITGGWFTAPLGVIALMRLRRPEVWNSFRN
jgi:hypothetical protein